MLIVYHTFRVGTGPGPRRAGPGPEILKLKRARAGPGPEVLKLERAGPGPGRSKNRQKSCNYKLHSKNLVFESNLTYK